MFLIRRAKTIKRFFGFVEIKTKITSIFAYLLALSFLFYKNININLELNLIFFVSMFVFDLTTTAINNYIDTKTNDQILQYQRKIALFIIVLLLFISVISGLYLVYRTDIVVLIAGMLCFMCGILYTGGPVPISRQPWGELLSGVFYGFFIPFLLLYINYPKGTFLEISINLKSINLMINIRPFITLILLSTTPVCLTANIMLANNICDLEKDVLVKRYTLPYYLGKRALYLFAFNYYLSYIAIVIMVAFKILSPICLLSIVTIFWVQKNINIFFKEQNKAKTFIVSIYNYIIIMGAVVMLIFISGLLI